MKTRKTTLSAVLLSTLTALLSVSQSLACSRAVYLGPEDTIITVRSMDWATDLGTNLWGISAWHGTRRRAGPRSVRWTSKYGSVVSSAFEAATADGMNEQGLVANLLYLAESDYQKQPRDAAQQSISISAWAQYVLDNFATVAEAVTALKQETFFVVPVENAGWPRGNRAPGDLRQVRGFSCFRICGRQAGHPSRSAIPGHDQFPCL